jgi:hypothetical protein
MEAQQDTENIDVMMVDEHSGKFLVKDLEQIEADRLNEKLRKRQRAEITGYGPGMDVDSDIEDAQMEDL